MNKRHPYQDLLDYIAEHPGISYGALADIIYEKSLAHGMFSHTHVLSMLEVSGKIRIEKNGFGNIHKDCWTVYPNTDSSEQEGVQEDTNTHDLSGWYIIETRFSCPYPTSSIIAGPLLDSQTEVRKKCKKMEEQIEFREYVRLSVCRFPQPPKHTTRQETP
jgi:hypothetical protein